MINDANPALEDHKQVEIYESELRQMLDFAPQLVCVVGPEGEHVRRAPAGARADRKVARSQSTVIIKGQ